MADIFSQLAQDTLSSLTGAPQGGDSPAAAGGDDPTAAIIQVAQERGIDPAHLLGLAKLETRAGQKTVRGDGADTRNLFNVKNFSRDGNGVRARDNAEGSNDRYRAYGSYRESAEDLIDLLERKYPEALNASTPEEFAQALKQGGYATDPLYARKLASTIRSSADLPPKARAAQPVQEWDQGASYIPMDSMLGGTDKPKPVESGVVDGVASLGKAVWQGTKSLGRSVMAAGNTAVGDLSDVELLSAAQKTDAKNNPQAMQALQEEIAKRKEANPEARWWQALGDVGDAAWQNKLGTAQLVLNQAPNSAAALGGAWAGGLTGAKIGAAAAPFTGGLSVPVGATVGALAGMFLGNYAMEAGSKALEKAEDGFTPEEARQSMTEGAKKAAVITAVDSATLGAGKMLGRTVFGAPVRAGAKAEAQVLANAGVDITNKAAIARAVANNQALKEAAIEAGKQAAKDASKFSTRAAQAGTGLAMETLGEGTGEYYGEMAATGKGDIYDAALEALSSASQSSIQTVQAMRSAEGNHLDPSGIVRAARQSGGIVSRAGLAATPGARQPPAGQSTQPGQTGSAQAGNTAATAGANAGSNPATAQPSPGVDATTAAEPNPYFTDMDDEGLKALGEFFTTRQTMTDGTPISDDDRKVGKEALAELARRQAVAQAGQKPAANSQDAIQASALSAIEQALQSDQQRRRAAGEVVDDDVTDVEVKAPAQPAAKPPLSNEPDPMLPQAIDFLRQGGKPSVSAVQRQLRIGFNRAARLLEDMQRDGIVGPMDEQGARQILKLPDPPDGQANTPSQPASSAGFSLPAFDNSPIHKMDPAAAEEQRRQAAEFEQKRKNRRAATRASVWERNPFLGFLGANGINRDVANEFAPGLVEKRKAFVPGYGPVFRSGAKNLDELVQNAKEDGFLHADDDVPELYDLIDRSLRGERIAPLYADGAAEAEGRRRQRDIQEREGATFEDYLPQAEADDFDPFPLMADSGYDAQDLAGTDFNQADDDVRAEVAALAAQYADLGFDPADVLEALSVENENQTEQTYYDRARTRLTDLISQAYEQAQPQGHRAVRADRAEPLPAGEAGARGPAAGQQVAPAAPTPKLRNVDELAAEGFNRVVKQGDKTYFVNPNTRESVELDSPAQIARARARVQAKQRLGNLRGTRPQDFALDAVTPEALKARDEQAQAAQAQQTAEQQAAAAQAKADDERKRIEQASYAAADSFELGQNPLDSLTGQQDIFGSAPVTQLDGVLASQPSQAAPAPLQDLVRTWDFANKQSRSDSWFDGAKVNNDATAGFSEALANGGQEVAAHGMSKVGSLTQGVNDLLSMIENGLDLSRRGGKLDTAPLINPAGSASTGTTPGGSAYSDGPFMLLARPGDDLSGNLDGLGAVLVNQAHAEIVPSLQEAIRAIRPDIIVGAYSDAGNVVRRLNAEPSHAPQAAPVAQDLAGERINDEWTAFNPQSGTLGIPRAQMPQIKAEHRGAMINFLKARGIDGQQETIPYAAIKPTQAEFSPAKVKQAMDYQGGNRSIIVSADGYVVDGHHQWLAAREKGEPIPAIRLDQNIGDVLAALKDMPSAQPDSASTLTPEQIAEQAQALLPTVRRYASGLTAIGDLAPGARASGGAQLRGVGVDVGLLSKNAIEVLGNAVVNQKAAVFVDSGAFSAFRRGLKSGEFEPLDFNAILARYDAILDSVGRYAEQDGEQTSYPRPLLVMPDVVGSQADSLALIREHRNWIAAEVQGNLSQPIIPIQKGEMSMAEAYRQVVQLVGSDDFIVGIPSNEEAVTPDELRQFLADAKPRAIHILGAASDAKLQPRLESVVAAGLAGKVQVTADASPIRSKVIRAVAKGAKRGEVIENLLYDENDPGYAQPEQGSKAEPVAGLFSGKPDPRNSAPLQELDGFKVGDAVDVPNRTIGRSRIEVLFKRTVAGDSMDLARIVNADGKKLDVLTSELVKVEDKQSTSVSGLSEGARLETGTKGQAKGKVRYVDGNGEALGNWSDTEAEALADAQKSQAKKSDNAEAAQRFQQSIDSLKRKALSGNSLTDTDLEAVGIKADGSEFPYMSAALQRLFGIHPRKVREAMGDAIRLGQGMYGGDKEFVPNPRRAIANAVQWMGSQPGMLYEQRNADRIARAKAADTQDAWDAITAEENADPERHFEGTDALRRAINARRLDLKPETGSFAIYPDRQEAAKPVEEDSQYPLVTHTTLKGKVLRGYIVRGMTLDEVKASIDPYALKKDGGVFVREQHKDKLPQAKPADDSATRWRKASQEDAAEIMRLGRVPERYSNSDFAAMPDHIQDRVRAGIRKLDERNAPASEQPAALPAQQESQAAPVFEVYADALKYVEDRAKALGLSKQKFTTTDEYKALYPQIKALYDAEKASSDAQRMQALKDAGLAAGDKVKTVVRSMFMSADEYTGTVVMRSGAPYVQIDGKMTVSRNGRLSETSLVRWDGRWTKVAGIQPSEASSDADTQAAAGPQWDAMTNAERVAIALEAGLPPAAAKKWSTREWAHIDAKVRDKLAAAIDTRQAQDNAVYELPVDEQVFSDELAKLVNRSVDDDLDAFVRGEAERDKATFDPDIQRISLPRVSAAKPRPDGVTFLPQAEADRIVQSWMDEAARQGRQPGSGNYTRTVISLFDASGVMSRPWEEAGYNVIRYDIQNGDDINDFDAEMLLNRHGNDNIWAIIAQPPCTDFASSGAQWWAEKDAKGLTELSNELVRQTMRTLELFRPPVWWLENPVGRMQRLNGLPDPVLSFDPWHFGDPWTKRTSYWGNFNPKLPTAMVEPVEGSKVHQLSSSAKFERSLTPEGVAYAMFMANNVQAMTVPERLAREFPGIEAKLFERALASGQTEQDIKGQIEDSFYENDLDTVREILAEFGQQAQPDLDAQLAQVNDELAAQGMVQNANTRQKRDQLRTAIAERDFPEILKAVDGSIDAAEALHQAFQFSGNEPKAQTIERVLKHRGISDEYRKRWAERLLAESKPAGREGYDTPVELDAAQLKAILEQTRGEPLVDKPAKLEAWRNGTANTDPAKFPIELVFRPDGKLDVNDGRHRIALAAERGEKVTAFIDGKDAQRAKDMLNAAPGTRFNGAAERAAADRLEKLYSKMDGIMQRNTREGAAKAAVRSVIEELRKPLTASSIVPMLDGAANGLDRQYSAMADVIREVAESLLGQPIQDFIDGKRDTAPTLEEVQAGTLDKLEKELADWQVRRELPINQAQTGVIDEEIAKLQAQIDALRGSTGQEDELDAEMSGYELKAAAEEAARYLKDFVYSLGELDGMTDRAQVELSSPLGKSGRDTLLMKAFGLTREEAHDINNRLDSRQPKKLRNLDMQEAFDIFPGLRQMVDEAIQKAAGRQSAAANADLEAIFDQLDGLTQRTQANGQRAAAAHPQAERIQFVQKHILDILQDLEDTRKVSINC